MRRLIVISILLICISFMGILNAQDKPSGFASVSALGLEGTTGGEGGPVVTVNSLDNLKVYSGSASPYIIIVEGLIEPESFSQVNVNSNKTIVGAGNNATLKNIELNITNKQNVIIRNLTIRDSYVEGDWDGKTNDYDAIQVDNSHHIWIDHCFLTHCGDGLIDLRLASNFITVSWTHLSNHNKAFGIGWTEDADWVVTIHHCWIDSTAQRNPSFGQGIGHLYNNYLYKNGNYGNYARGLANVVVENSYFCKSNDPLKYDADSKLYSSGNIFQSCSGNKSGNVEAMPIDPSQFYEYTLDPAEQVRSILISGCGPQTYIANQYTGDADEDYYFAATVADGNGTVEIDTATVKPMEYFTVEAIPEYGWELAGWNIDQLGTTNPVTLIAGDSLNLVASFKKSYFTLRTLVSAGEGTVEPKTSSFEYGQNVSITAVPAEGWKFDHWEGDLTGNTNPETITVSQELNVSAYFVQEPSAFATYKEEGQFQYYINRGQRTLHWQSTKPMEVSASIYTMDGKMVFQNNYSQISTNEISLSGFKSGVYIIKFIGGRNIQTGQFIIY